MNANSPWLAAHGRLWYDDRRYRIAWIIWPQAAGLLIFVVLWLNYPAAQGVIPWAKPVLEATQNPTTAVVPQPQPQPQPQPYQTPTPQPPDDALAPCKGENWGSIIPACTTQLMSGKLRGNDVAWAYWYRGWAYYQTKQYQLAMNDYDRAITMNSREPDFYNDRGTVWKALEKKERALQDYDQAILLKSDY